MEEINVIQEVIEEVETVDAVIEEAKGIDWKAYGLAGLGFTGAAVITTLGIKYLVKKHKAKSEAKKAKQKAESTFTELGDAIDADFDKNEEDLITEEDEA